MSDMIADGLAWLNDQLKSYASQSYVYRRGAYSVSIAVTPGKPKIDPLNLLAGVMANRDLSQPSPKHVDHYFGFDAGDLVLNGNLVEPADGDTLEVTVNGKTTTYILSAPLDGGPSWSYVNGYEFGDAARIVWTGRLKSVV